MSDEEYVEPWSWIPHVEGADRQREINAYLSKMLDEIPYARGPMIVWNPDTEQMEPYTSDVDLGERKK